jgi:hypothetical protein
VGIYGSSDQIKFVIDKPDASDPGVSGSLSSSEQFYRFQVNYENHVTDDLTVSLMGAVGKNLELQRIGSLRVDADYTITTLRSDLTYQIGKALALRGGWDILVGQYGANVRAPRPTPDGADPGPLIT